MGKTVSNILAVKFSFRRYPEFKKNDTLSEKVEKDLSVEACSARRIWPYTKRITVYENRGCAVQSPGVPNIP
jgi:hypothetical protein